MIRFVILGFFLGSLYLTNFSSSNWTKVPTFIGVFVAWGYLWWMQGKWGISRT